MFDLRYRTKDVLRVVERGETVTILHGGKEKARILPLVRSRGKGKLRTSEAFGLWKDRKGHKDVSAFIRKLRKGRF